MIDDSNLHEYITTTNADLGDNANKSSIPCEVELSWPQVRIMLTSWSTIALHVPLHGFHFQKPMPRATQFLSCQHTKVPSELNPIIVYAYQLRKGYTCKHARWGEQGWPIEISSNESFLAPPLCATWTFVRGHGSRVSGSVPKEMWSVKNFCKK